MGTTLKLLLVEDSETDAMLLIHHLKKGGYDPVCERVETKAAMEAALDWDAWDVVVSDLILPNFSGLAALEVLGQKGMDIPFIMVSGKAGEETAVTAMKAGAHDYLLKDNMSRLVPVIERELKEAKVRHERKRVGEQLDLASALIGKLETSERRFRSVVETANEAVIVIDGVGKVVFWNRGAEKLFGYTSEEAAGSDLGMIIPERHRDRHAKSVAGLIAGGRGRLIGKTVELHGLRKDGSEVPVELSLASWESGEGRFYTGIVRDISERKELELQRADFFAMVTHDIKSPLSVIVGNADLILDLKRDKADPEVLGMVEQILKSAEKLDDLVEAFLTHARFESGTAQLKKKPVDLAGLVADVWKEYRRRAEDAGLTLKLDAPEHLPAVLADREYMTRAVENLVGNAVAYTPKGGQVTLKAEVEGKGNDACIIISVIDTGPGIPPEEQARVFDKYYRSSSAGEVRGSGLGLAIVKAVADAHSASVHLDSTPGKGSCFKLCMPIKPE